jgi:hypothetical protein
MADFDEVTGTCESLKRRGPLSPRAPKPLKGALEQAKAATKPNKASPRKTQTSKGGFMDVSIYDGAVKILEREGKIQTTRYLVEEMTKGGKVFTSLDPVASTGQPFTKRLANVQLGALCAAL